jgi:hypothetical protein
VANQAGSAPLSEHAVNADMDSHDHPTGEHPNKTFLKQKKRNTSNSQAKTSPILPSASRSWL